MKRYAGTRAEGRNVKLKIGVMGSATGEMTSHSLAAAFELGKAVAEADCHLITGGCPGLPVEAARGAKSLGGLVIGISPGLSVDEHVRKYQSPTEFHDVLVFTGSGLMGREVVNIRLSPDDCLERHQSRRTLQASLKEGTPVCVIPIEA